MIKTFETNEGKTVTLDFPESPCSRSQSEYPARDCYKCVYINGRCCFSGNKLLTGSYREHWEKYIVNGMTTEKLPTLIY